MVKMTIWVHNSVARLFTHKVEMLVEFAVILINIQHEKTQFTL
jgi:hypothetical protein